MSFPSRRSMLKTLSATALSRPFACSAKSDIEETSLKEPFVVRANESRLAAHYHIRGMDLYVKVSGQDTHQQLAIFYGTYHKDDGPPLHVHYKQDEEFYILEGEFLVQVGDKQYTLQAGDLIFLPRLIPHTFVTLSETGKMLFSTQPSGKMEALFKQLAQLGPTASADAIQQIHLACDQKVLGPPLRLKE